MLAKSFEKEFARSCKMIHATKNVASAKTLVFCSNANRGNIAKITSNCCSTNSTNPYSNRIHNMYKLARTKKQWKHIHKRQT